MRDNEANNKSQLQAINDNNQHSPFFSHSGGHTNGNYKEYYRNGHLESISLVVATIFTVFRCSTSVLITVSYHTQYMSLKHAFFTWTADNIYKTYKTKVYI